MPLYVTLRMFYSFSVPWNFVSWVLSRLLVWSDVFISYIKFVILFLWLRHLVSCFYHLVYCVCCIISWVMWSRVWDCHLVSLRAVWLQTGSPAGVSTITCWSSPTTTSSARRTAWSCGGCTTTPVWPPPLRGSRNPSCGTTETAPRATTSSARNYRKAQVRCSLVILSHATGGFKYLPFLPFRFYPRNLILFCVRFIPIYTLNNLTWTIF